MSDIQERINKAVELAESLGHKVYIPNVWGAYTMLECKNQCACIAVLKWYPAQGDTGLTGNLVDRECKGHNR